VLRHLHRLVARSILQEAMLLLLVLLLVVLVVVVAVALAFLWG